ncbi:MAG: glycosyltransferase family 2 protein [Marinilabiliaceae bacterium]
MKVSIVTSCFNRVGVVSEAIESVLSQDYDDIEYIVVDAASTDGSLDIIRSYGGRISKIKSEPDHGIYEGLNKGIRMATGDIIGILHSDDVFYASDTISSVVAEMKRTGAEFLYGNGIFVKLSDPNYVVRDWVSGGYVRDSVKKGWLPLHTTCFVKRMVFDKVGFYDERYKIAADTDWLVRCLYVNSLRVAYLDSYVVRMRMGGASTSFRQMRLKWSEDLAIYKSHGIGRFFPLSLKIMSKVPQFVKARLKRLVKHKVK